MAQLVTYELTDGTPVRFEIEGAKGFQQASGGAKVAGKVSEAAASVLRAAGEVLEQAKALGPEEIALSFSLKVTGEVGWAIAKAGTEGSFELTLTWRPTLDKPLAPTRSQE
jgi:hypothetical protein